MFFLILGVEKGLDFFINSEYIAILFFHVLADKMQKLMKNRVKIQRVIHNLTQQQLARKIDVWQTVMCCNVIV